MRIRPVLAGLVSLVLLQSPVAAQEGALDAAVSRCLAVDTSSSWKAAAARWSAIPNGQASNPALRARLLAMEVQDQAVRSVPGIADSMQSETFLRRMMESDAARTDSLMAIVAEHGWPGRSMVGKDGARAAFLIAQHGERYDREALRIMQALPAGEVSPEDLALLEDRVRSGEGLPQRFGTQLKLSEDGQRMVFDPIENVAELDARRASVGLPPIAIYSCILGAHYGREVQDPRTAAAPR